MIPLTIGPLEDGEMAPARPPRPMPAACCEAVRADEVASIAAEADPGDPGELHPVPLA